MDGLVMAKVTNKWYSVSLNHINSNKKKGKPMERAELPLKAFDEYTVEMDITHCGICGSDIHTMDSGWGGRFFINFIINIRS